jgi:hypothetical protein
MEVGDLRENLVAILRCIATAVVGMEPFQRAGGSE